MINLHQPGSRSTLDRIIQQSIEIYRWAVLLAFGFIAAGFVVELVRNEQVPNEMGSPRKMIGQLVDFHAAGFFGIGIGVMILAPIVMIAAAAIRFFQSGDRRYGLISTAVAVILSLSIALSFILE